MVDSLGRDLAEAHKNIPNKDLADYLTRFERMQEQVQSARAHLGKSQYIFIKKKAPSLKQNLNLSQRFVTRNVDFLTR